MPAPGNDRVFIGSVPRIYDTYLVPLIFEPYAADIVSRLSLLAPKRVLEVAAGTGVVTRAMSAALPEGTTIVVTDLNQPMLDRGAAIGTKRPVEWRQADAMKLPFPDGSFDAVVCQFGVMFFPDRRQAYTEARRVLRPGGVYLFNTWDRIEENEFADAVTAGVATLFPNDPCLFLKRTPHGYHDPGVIANELADAGFTATPEIVLLPALSRAKSYRDPAIAYCQGTPLCGEIETRDPSALERATDAAAEEVARRFGRGAVDAKIQANVVMVER